jgi:hypothetical protein
MEISALIWRNSIANDGIARYCAMWDVNARNRRIANSGLLRESLNTMSPIVSINVKTQLLSFQKAFKCKEYRAVYSILFYGKCYRVSHNG